MFPTHTISPGLQVTAKIKTLPHHVNGYYYFCVLFVLYSILFALVCSDAAAAAAASRGRRALKAQKDEATATLLRAQEEKTEERNRIMAEREVYKTTMQPRLPRVKDCVGLSEALWANGTWQSVSPHLSAKGTKACRYLPIPADRAYHYLEVVRALRKL